MVQWKKLRITATGLVSGISAGNTYGGIITQAVGTTTTIAVYDDVAATAASLITPVTASTSLIVSCMNKYLALPMPCAGKGCVRAMLYAFICL